MVDGGSGEVMREQSRGALSDLIMLIRCIIPHAPPLDSGTIVRPRYRCAFLRALCRGSAETRAASLEQLRPKYSELRSSIPGCSRNIN